MNDIISKSEEHFELTMRWICSDSFCSYVKHTALLSPATSSMDIALRAAGI
jgi:hypothetical protein